MNEELTYHVPVLLKPSVDGMNIRPDGTYVDVTFGGGGHSREILSRLRDGGRLLGFDQDEDAEQNIVDNPHFMRYLPIWVCPHITSMIASGDSHSVLMVHWICV